MMRPRRRLPPAPLALLLASGLLVSVPARPAIAQEVEPPPPPEGVSIVQEPQMVQIPPPTADERIPEDTPDDINAEPNPDEVIVEWPEGTSPEEQIDALVLVPLEGSESVDVLAEDKVSGEHFAVVYPDIVNDENRRGAWGDIALDPVPSDYGWVMQGDGFFTELPAQMDPATPLVLHLAQGDFAASPVGLQQVPGTPDGNSIVYSAGLPGTEFVYTPAPGGYKEAVNLLGPEASLTVSWDITTGFGLRPLTNGTIEVFDASGPIGTLATPVVYDSAEPANQTLATYGLEQTGETTWRLSAQIPADWAASATYPLTLDPGTTGNISPSDDTYVNSGNKTANYGSDAKLEVGPSYRSFIKFPTSWQSAGRIVYTARIWLYNTYQADPNAPVDVKRTAGGWSNNGATWNDQPPTSDTPSLASVTGPSGGWWDIGVGKVYQAYNDGTYADQGVRLSGGRKTFNSSSAASNRPYLLISYNDLPNSPQIDGPADDKVFDTDTPTLKINRIPSDPNGDDVLVNYQITSVQGDWTGSSVKASGWTDEESFTVPSGWLIDGTNYWWRVISRDVCSGTDDLCELEDAAGTEHEPSSSYTRSFTVLGTQYGSDPRWAMWSKDLGNSMTLSINEATGNAYLDVPLDSLPTPLGRLSLGLSYNSQKDAKGIDKGLGNGWSLHAGPGASARHLPESLDPPPADQLWEGVSITFRSGREQEFPWRGGNTFSPLGAGAGVVTRDNDDGFAYVAEDGDRFTFDQSGDLQTARPVSSNPAAAASGAYYAYTFGGAGYINQITDPSGRAVTFTWEMIGTDKRLTAISTWVPGGDWTLAYAGNSLSSATNPEGETLRFMSGENCTGQPLIDEIRNGQQFSDQTPGWTLDYLNTGANNWPTCHVTKAFSPQMNPTRHYSFDYGYAGAGFNGYTSLATAITDPRGTSGDPSSDFMTRVDFSVAGYPIQITAAKEHPGTEPDWVTTMYWNDRGQLACKASPQANAIRAACGKNNQSDPLATVWDYDQNAPYRLASVTGPAPATSSDLRMRTTYSYDDGGTFQGLWAAYFDNKWVRGQPVAEGTYTDLTQDWDLGSPPEIEPNDTWSMRIWGLLDISAKNTYEFKVIANEGVAMTVGDKVLLDCFTRSDDTEHTSCGQQEFPKALLHQGRRPITIEFRDVSGKAVLKVFWRIKGTTAWEEIPLSVMIPNTQILTAQETGPTNGTDTLRTQVRYGYPNDQAKWLHLPTFKDLTDVGRQITRRSTYGYDAYGRRTQVTRFAGTSDEVSTIRTYTDNAQTSCLTTLRTGVTSTDPGASTNYVCNTAGDVTQITREIDRIEVSGTVLQEHETRTTDMIRDAMGRLTRVAGPSSSQRRAVQKFDYDLSGRLIEEQTLLEENDPGQTTDDTWAVTAYAYDDYGASPTLVVTGPDPDRFGTSPDGPLQPATVIHTFDQVGNEISVTDPRDQSWLTETEYDAQNRITRVKTPNPGTGALFTSTTYSVSPLQVTTLSENSGAEATVHMDLLGRADWSQTGTGAVSYTFYDAAGNARRTEVEDPASGSVLTWQETDHDAMGAPTVDRVPWVDAAGEVQTATTDYTYQASTGRLQEIDGPLGNNASHSDRLVYAYDPSGQVVSVQMWTKEGPNENFQTRVIYNDGGEQLQIQTDLTDDGTKVQRRDFSYTQQGLVSKITEYHGGAGEHAVEGSVQTTKDYDEAGRLISVTDERDPDGAGPQTQTVLHFSYDTLGAELKRWSSAGGDTVTSTYDGAGLLQTTRRGGTEGITYTLGWDKLGRLQSVVDDRGEARRTDYDYNFEGELASVKVKVAGQEISVQAFDYYRADSVEGLLKSVTDSITGAKLTYGYDDAGRPVSRTDTQGTQTVVSYARTYEAKTGRTNTQQVRNGQGETLAFFDLGYDKAGSVTSRVQKLWWDVPLPSGQNPANQDGDTGSGTWTYDYDGAGRMVQAQGTRAGGGSYSEENTYDGAGNRTGTAVGGSSCDFDTDLQGWVWAKDCTGGSLPDETYTLDETGQLLGVSSGSASTTLSYDSFGHMVDQQVLGGAYSHDELDAFGRVIERTIDAASESFTYQGTSEALVQSKVGETATTFAQGPSGPIGYASGNNTRLYIKDLHSDVVAETPASGAGVGILRASWYSPWGERETLEGSLGLLGFQGQPQTQLADGPELVDMTTRYYAAGLGRFTTGDVLFGEVSDPMSLNRFAYAGGSPVTFTDPSGMCVLDETTGGCYQAPTDTATGSSGSGSERPHGGAHPRSWLLPVFVDLHTECFTTPPIVMDGGIVRGTRICEGPGGVEVNPGLVEAYQAIVDAFVGDYLDCFTEGVCGDDVGIDITTLGVGGWFGRADNVIKYTDELTNLAKLRKFAPGVSDDVLEMLDYTYRRALTQYEKGNFTFAGHDGKPFLGMGLEHAIAPAHIGNMKEFVVARPGSRLGPYRIIIAGEVTEPEALYLWAHGAMSTDPGTIYRLM